MPDARIISEVVVASATIDRLELRKALGALMPVIERRNTIPILSCVRLGFQAGHITLGASDLDIYISTSIAVETIGVAAIAMESPGRLVSLLGKLSGNSVGIQVIERRDGATFVMVSSGTIRAEFPTCNVDDFPAAPVQPGGAKNLHFGGAQLLEAIERTRFAISTEETRYYLNGIYLHAAKSGDVPVLRAVATDGHRLVLTEIAPDLTLPPNDDLPRDWGYIIPRKAVSLLAAFAKQGAVDLSFWSMWMCAKSGESVMFSKMIDGTFPDYERVIPSNNDKSAVLPSDLIRLAVSRVSLGATERTKVCRLTLGPDRIVLQSRSVEGLSITETVALPEKPNMPSNFEFEHGLNARYLSEALRHFPGAAMYRWADGASPLLIHAADVPWSQVTHLAILMPIRV